MVSVERWPSSRGEDGNTIGEVEGLASAERWSSTQQA